MDNVLGFLKKFDAYPKTLEDFRVRTYAGAVVSILSGLVIVILLVSEFRYYQRVEVKPVLMVDTTRGEKLRINLDVSFPAIPCAYLSLDAMDVSGAHQLDVAHNVIKRRLSPDGDEIGSMKEDVNTEPPTEKPADAAPGADRGCPSCYGAESAALRCCFTCDDVREAYRIKGWSFTNPAAISQCSSEKWAEKFEAQAGEGCRFEGFLLVNKVAGNFHFAPGKSFQSAAMHVHDLNVFKDGKFNLSHVFNALSFGHAYPGRVDPLDNVAKIQTLSAPWIAQYYVKIVPTVYVKSGEVIQSNQFSVTEHSRYIESASAPSAHSHGQGVPGLFVVYDLSPIMVQFTEHRKSFLHFLTQVCAIVGGVFTVAGIIDSFIYNGVRSLREKLEIGKYS